MNDEAELARLNAEIAKLKLRISPLEEKLRKLKRRRRPLAAALASSISRRDKAEQRNGVIRADFDAQALNSPGNRRLTLPYGQMNQFAKDHKLSVRTTYAIIRKTSLAPPAAHRPPGERLMAKDEEQAITLEATPTRKRQRQSAPDQQLGTASQLVTPSQIGPSVDARRTIKARAEPHVQTELPFSRDALPVQPAHKPSKNKRFRD